MRKLLYVGAAVVALATGSSSGNAMSINIGAGLKPALDAVDVIQKAAVFIVEAAIASISMAGTGPAGIAAALPGGATSAGAANMVGRAGATDLPSGVMAAAAQRFAERSKA